MEKVNTIATKIINFIVKIFWIFVIGSIFGFVVEMIYATMYTRSITIRQGLIYGPFIPIYGLGGIAYYLLVLKVKEPKDAFFCGMIMGGILEYLCSFCQEILFGTVSWDYSNYFFNLNGRTCLLYCIYWGIIALVFLKVIYPWLKALEHNIYKKHFKLVTMLLVIFMSFDITISCMAATRQEERHNNIEPRNGFERFLDKTYPDEYMDKVYNNKKEIK